MSVLVIVGGATLAAAFLTCTALMRCRQSRDGSACDDDADGSGGILSAF
jgi:hypothetical protein